MRQKTMSKPDEIVAVKLEGCFTEWYSPNYKEPYVDNAVYRQYFEENIMDKQPVAGPVLGGGDGAFLTDDLQCLAERICCGAKDWAAATEDLEAAIGMSLADGKTRNWEYAGVGNVKITPFTKAQMPPLTDDALKVFGKFGYLIRERYEAI